MEKIIFATTEEARNAAFEMEKARMVLEKNGVLSKKYNALIKKRIRRIITTYKIQVY
jgi:hypothetical protein